MQKNQTQQSISNQPRYLMKRQLPSFTIQLEHPLQKFHQHTYNDLFTHKSQEHIVLSQHLSSSNRKSSMKQSIKLPTLNNFMGDPPEITNYSKKRTSSIENSKKVDFHPSVLVIFSEYGLKRREKLTEEPQLKRTSKRKNCILIQKKRKESILI